MTKDPFKELLRYDKEAPKNLLESFDRLCLIVSALRDPKRGCPWDLEQTHESIRPYLIEECHEALDAMKESSEAFKKELGDVLLQVLLHSQIAKDAGTFTIEDVVNAIANKMVERHPHVFGDEKKNNSQEVLESWEQRKQKELKGDKSVLDGVPKGMPALLRAQRIGDKAARVGFEWRSVKEVRDKVIEEVKEFAEVEDPERIKDEFGDILFALTQLARRLSLNSEDLLNDATGKFTRRFKEMEKRVNGKVSDHSLEELDAIWEEIKKEEHSI